MKNGIFFVLGGSKSGKTAFADGLAKKIGKRTVFIATAKEKDEEMKERIAKYQAKSPDSWHLIDAPEKVAEAIRSCKGQTDVIIVDCMTLLVQNLMMQNLGWFQEDEKPDIIGYETFIENEIKKVLEAASEINGLVIFVSDEIGEGLKPETKLSKFYGDLVGRMNQQVAAFADKVFLLTCGLALELKSQSVSIDQVVMDLVSDNIQDF